MLAKLSLQKACEQTEATCLGKVRGGEVTFIAFSFERLDMRRWILTNGHGLVWANCTPHLSIQKIDSKANNGQWWLQFKKRALCAKLCRSSLSEKWNIEATLTQR